MLSPPFPVVLNHLLCLDHVEGEVGVLASHGQVSDLLPVGCLVVVGDQAYHCCVIGKLNDGVGVVPGRAVMSSTFDIVCTSQLSVETTLVKASQRYQLCVF
jgi:hypothetical protein